MTAVGTLCRQYLGLDPKDPGVLEGKRSLMENLPDNVIGRNTYYWYYATLSMHNFQDADWDAWNRKMRRALIETQVHAAAPREVGIPKNRRPTLGAATAVG